MQNIISFKNKNQIINMGGPWIGDLYLNDLFITKNVIMDNIVEKDKEIFFVKYISNSRWNKKNYFVVCKLDYSNNEFYQYSHKFKKVFINDIKNNILEYYESFSEGIHKKLNKISLQ